MLQICYMIQMCSIFVPGAMDSDFIALLVPVQWEEIYAEKAVIHGMILHIYIFYIYVKSCRVFSKIISFWPYDEECVDKVGKFTSGFVLFFTSAFLKSRPQSIFFHSAGLPHIF